MGQFSGCRPFVNMGGCFSGQRSDAEMQPAFYYGYQQQQQHIQRMQPSYYGYQQLQQHQIQRMQPAYYGYQQQQISKIQCNGHQQQQQQRQKIQAVTLPRNLSQRPASSAKLPSSPSIKAKTPNMGDEGDIECLEVLESFQPAQRSTWLQQLQEHKKDVLLLVLLSIMLPCWDVYSDLALTIRLALEGEVYYALCLLTPQ